MKIRNMLISRVQTRPAGLSQGSKRHVVSCLKYQILLTSWSMVVFTHAAFAQPTSKVLEAVKPNRGLTKQVEKAEEHSKEQPWLKSLAEGYQQARLKGMPIFVKIEGQSCPYCKILNAEIKKTIVQAELGRWILVRLDIDKTPADARLLAVGPIPALRILTPTGQVIESKDGALSAENLVEWLQEHYSSATVVPDESLLASGPPDALAVIRLVKLFKHRDAVLREAAIQKLIPYPDPAAAIVVNAFSEGTLASQLTALELLREWKAPVEGLDPWDPKSISPERLKKLSAWIEHIDHSEAIPVKKELTSSELDSCRKMITSMLTATPDETRAIRERLARFGKLLLAEVTGRLKSIESDEDRERLTALRYRLVATDKLVLEWPGGIERLAATDVAIRHNAIDELSTRATSQEQELLLELFSDPSPLVRELSLRTLTEVGGASTSDALIRLLKDPEPNVRAAVLKQLSEKPSSRIVPEIAAYVTQEKDPDLVVHAVRLFREAKGNAAAEALIKLLSHPSWRVRAESAESITKVVGHYSPDKALHTDVYMALIKLLEDEDSFVVSRAVAALSDADLIVAVEPLTKAASRHPELAAEVVKSLSHGEKQGVESIPYLRKFCTHDQPEVRAAAITGLSSLIPSEVKNELQQLLSDEDSLVRTAAANALFKLLSSETFSPSDSITGNSPFDSFIPETNGKLPLKTDAGESQPELPDEKTTDETLTTDNPDESHTREYENMLAAIRQGKMREPWMFDLAPQLERLIEHESVEEQLAGARALAGLGQDRQAIPKLREILKLHPENSSTIASVLPWLLWEDRIQLFLEITQSADSLSDLYEVMNEMSQPRDHRALNTFWDLLARRDVDAAFAHSMIMSMRKIYFNTRYYSLDDVSVGAKNRAVADLIPHTLSGLYWQRTVALVALFSLSREEAYKLANRILSDKSTSDDLREVAFQVVLASQSKSQATQMALQRLTDKNPMLQQIALAYLSVGPQAVSSVANKKLALESSFLVSSSFEKAGIPIIPEAPEELDSQILTPLLNSSDPQTVAYAGYLLTLFDDPQGFSPLLSYWEENAKQDAQWTRLVYRAIAYQNDTTYVPLLKTIYEKHIDKRRYYDKDLKDFYWTIRIMSGPEILAFRKRIRDEVGMERLR
ncbi:HEAT repeat domain-containing protein [Gimesia algae]|uniref:HEAT repeat protein n=1 Tax=Gimesia algae TaxID=2527971 RepID=A0A517VKV3_9PLAN|nr:HEAT repeat domain-containing protein [Gimesia algae]QDT93653.1 HEAT repeat protein [Gimesia algae]